MTAKICTDSKQASPSSGAPPLANDFLFFFLLEKKSANRPYRSTSAVVASKNPAGSAWRESSMALLFDRSTYMKREREREREKTPAKYAQLLQVGQRIQRISWQRRKNSIDLPALASKSR